MASNAVVAGPTAAQVAANVERIRKARQLHQKDLSVRLGEIGRPMLPTVISKIERGERRVDVDDLVALAIALNVSPAALLLPPEWDDSWVKLTPDHEVRAKVAWQWIEGRAPASKFGEDDVAAVEDDDDSEREYWRQREEYEALTHPPQRRRASGHPVSRAGRTVSRAADAVAVAATTSDASRGRAALDTMQAGLVQLRGALGLAALKLGLEPEDE